MLFLIVVNLNVGLFLFDCLATCFVEVVVIMFGFMRVCFVEVLLVFMLRFNVSSFPLMFFSGGVSGAIFFLSVYRFLFQDFVFVCLFMARLLCFGLCVKLLWLCCFYVHVQCLSVGFDDFLGKC